MNEECLWASEEGAVVWYDGNQAHWNSWLIFYKHVI